MIRKTYGCFFCILFIVIFSVSVMAMPPHPKLLDEMQKKGLYQQLIAKMQEMRARGMDTPKRSSLTTGTVKVLVLIIGYSDISISNPGTITVSFTDLLANNTLSMKQYYLDMSNNALNLTFDVVALIPQRIF